MIDKEPITELDARFSSEGATPAPWAEGRERLEGAEVYWISTVRPDGRPHVTPLLGAGLDGALYFCTGPDERKAKNLAQNPRCVLNTGCNRLGEGLDLVIEGDVARLTDEAALRRVADAYLSKYGEAPVFAVRDGAFYHDPESLREADPGAAWCTRCFRGKSSASARARRSPRRAGASREPRRQAILNGSISPPKYPPNG